jgi:DNA-binding LacI/PurR family transcriptional regulator
MTEYLISLGHRRIGMLQVKDSAYASEERVRGYKQMLAHKGLPLDESLMVDSGDWTEEAAYSTVSQLLERPDRPTAVFALNDRMALGVLQWAREHKLRVPEDLTVVGFDDSPAAAAGFPPLTTIRQPSVEMGRQSVKLLFKLLEGGSVSSRVVVGTELVVRASSGPPPKKV